MAQGAVTAMPFDGIAFDPTQSVHEIQELRKIVAFRDAVLAGQRPQFKVPANIVGPRQTSSPNVLQPRPNPPSNQTPAEADVQGKQASSPYSQKTLYGQTVQSGKSVASGSTVDKVATTSGINPILLEKSDDLIKAEIQLQRQRLERALREQVEQRRISLKAALQTSESLPDFDLSDVLSKALTIVNPSLATDAEPSVGRTSASDSFDENTFYSSQHDTPEPSTASLVQTESGEVPVQGGSAAATHPIQAYRSRDYEESRDVVMTGTSLSHDADSDVQELSRAPIVQPNQIASTTASSTHKPEASRQMQNEKPDDNITDIPDDAPLEHHTNNTTDFRNQTTNTSGSISTSKNRQELADRHTVLATTNELMAQAHPDSPRVYAHDLSPIAPQPARVSPLVANKLPPIIQQSVAVEEALPGQVAALHQPLSGPSSPESSPKDNKTSEKKKGKKKKSRKFTGKQAAINTPDSPYIKPEPRSPSPFSAAPLPRPRKRQRQTFQQGQELNYDEPRYEDHVEEPQVVVVPRRCEERPQSAFIRPEEPRTFDPRGPEPPMHRRGPREESHYRRVVSHDVRATPPIEYRYARPYSPTERPLRAASQLVVDRPIASGPGHYGRDMLPPRASVRPDADRDRSRSPILNERHSPLMMAPPRPAPRRIIVDEYGRQFYAPSTAPLRPSVAPSARIGEEGVVYERAPLRAIPRAVAETYEQDGIIYRRSSPLAPPPRRVVTQPEYEPDYRAYRQREYSVRPIPTGGPSEEYVRVREPVERRQMSHFDEPPRDYLARVGSVRPEPVRYEAPREFIGRVSSVRPEAVRYEPPREYVGRMSSARPEPIGPEYASSVRPEIRREIPAQALRDYSVRPGEVDLPGREREYLPVTDAVYAAPRPVARRMVDDVEYANRPHEVHSAVYADTGLPEIIYR